MSHSIGWSLFIGGLLVMDVVDLVVFVRAARRGEVTVGKILWLAMSLTATVALAVSS